MTNAMVFDAKAWEWNKDSLTIMEMQAAKLQALCTCYNLKLAKTGKATAAVAIVNHLMVPKVDVVTNKMCTMLLRSLWSRLRKTFWL